MNSKSQKKKISKIKIRARRVRSKMVGTAAKPRASVFRSHRHISVQLINDTAHKTLLSASDLELQKNQKKITGRGKAKAVGLIIAKKSLDKKINTVIFDRGAYKYHGQVKELAEGMREGGLKL